MAGVVLNVAPYTHKANLSAKSYSRRRSQDLSSHADIVSFYLTYSCAIYSSVEQTRAVFSTLHREIISTVFHYRKDFAAWANDCATNGSLRATTLLDQNFLIPRTMDSFTSAAFARSGSDSCCS